MPLHLIAWGDSLTSGGDWMGQLPYLGLADATWEDHGQPGEASWEAVPRFGAWLESAQPHPGDVVVLMWGTNDVRRSEWSASASLDALAGMKNAAEAKGYPVIDAVPPPMMEAGFTTAADVLLFNTRLEAIDAGADCRFDIVADVFDAWWDLPGFPDLSYYTQQDGFADGVHPGTVTAISGHPGRYHLAEPIAQAIFLPEPGPPALLFGALLLAGLRRVKNARSRRGRRARPRTGSP